MSQQAFAWSRGTNAPPKPVAGESDPKLAFMLARQAINHLQFELRSLGESVATARDPEFRHYETTIALGRVEALENRMRPFTAFIDQATRFEAQEILVALDGIREELAQFARPAEPKRTGGAAEVAARLLGRRD